MDKKRKALTSDESRQERIDVIFSEPTYRLILVGEPAPDAGASEDEVEEWLERVEYSHQLYMENLLPF